MALNFGILQPVNIGGQFMAGQQQAQENQLAQQQAAMRQQEMGMRQQEIGMRQQEATAQAEDRATKLANAEKRSKFLTNLSAQMEKGGHKLNRETLSSMMNFGLQNNEDSLVKLAGEGLRALNEQEQFAGIMGGGAPAAIRPSVAPGAMGSGTFDPNAPMAAAAPAAVNALIPAPAGPDVNDMRRKRDQLLAMGTTRSIAAANALDRDIALASKTSDTPEVATMKALGYPPTQAGYQAYRDAQRQERMLTPLEEAQRVRIATASRAPRPEAAPRTQQVKMDNGTIGIMNMDTGAVTPATLGGAPVKSQPSAFAEKTAVLQKQQGKDINLAITEIENAIKPGGLLDKSTASGAGRLYDIGAGFFGNAPEGAIAAASLKPIADLGLKMVPRFEGPQSNADTISYKEASGQLANESLPIKIRRAAAQTMIRIMKSRKGQFANEAMAAEGIAPSAPSIAPPTGFTPDQQ